MPSGDEWIGRVQYSQTSDPRSLEFRRRIASERVGTSQLDYVFAPFYGHKVSVGVWADRSNLKALPPYINTSNGSIVTPVQVTTVTPFNPGTDKISLRLSVSGTEGYYSDNLDLLIGKSNGYKVNYYIPLEERNPIPRNSIISLKTQVNPENISAETTRDDNSESWNSGTEDFFIENIPGILGARGFTTGGGYLNFWIDAGVRIKDPAIRSFDWDLPFVHATPTSWLLLTRRVNDKFNEFIQPTTSGFLTDEARVVLSGMATKAFKTSPTSTSVSLSSPLLWTNDIKAYHEQHFNYRVVESGYYYDYSYGYPSGYSLDDVTSSFGRFSFYIVPIGTASLTADGNRYLIKIKQVAVHVLDSFDFNDSSISWKDPSTWVSQALGCYSLPDKVRPPLFPGTCVKNSTFQWYRRMKARGGDFIVFTTPHIITFPQSVAFYVNK